MKTQKQKDYARSQYILSHAYITDLKAKTPRKDCGQYFHPTAMEFDHLRDKKGDVGTMASRYSFKKVQEEIEKCELGCANCHRVRTYNRRNHNARMVERNTR